MRINLVTPSIVTADGATGVIGGGERYAVELARAIAELTPARLVAFGPRRRWRDRSLEVCVHPPWLLSDGDATNPFELSFVVDLIGGAATHCIGHHKWVSDWATLCARAMGQRAFFTDIGGGGRSLSTYAEANLGGRDAGDLAHGHLALSEFAIAQFPCHRAKSRIIFGGVDPERFTPERGRRRRHLLFVGRLLPHKGVDRLIQAVDARTPLVVAGRPYHADYWRRLQQLSAGKQVEFITDADDAALVELYRSAIAVVLPSTYRDCYGGQHRCPELLGLALLEGMSCETPAICTPVGGMPEVVRDGVVGRVAVAEHASALATAIAEVVANRRRARQWGRNAREWVLERFTWQATARRCLRAYRGAE